MAMATCDRAAMTPIWIGEKSEELHLPINILSLFVALKTI